MKLTWSPRSLQRVGDITEYIARNSPSAARKWIIEIFDVVKRLKRFPHSGRIVPETDRTDIREIFFGDYRIVHRVEKHQVAILTVRHGRQLLPIEDLAQ